MDIISSDKIFWRICAEKGKNKKGRSVGGILFYYPNILKIFFPLRQVVRECPLTKLSKNIINETQEVYREGVYNIPKNNFCQK